MGNGGKSVYAPRIRGAKMVILVQSYHQRCGNRCRGLPPGFTEEKRRIPPPGNTARCQKRREEAGGLSSLIE
jgi:hypothetical protein